MGVTDTDHGWGKLTGELRKLRDDQTLYVGIQGQDAERDEGGATNAEVAHWHEFGTTTGVPERSFLRATLDTHRETYARILERGMARVVDGALTLPQLLGLLGEKVVADVRNRIKTGIPPELKPATLRRKTRADGAVGFVPLILTGQLIQAVSYVVRRGRREPVAGGES